MSDNSQAIYGEPQVVELVAGDVGIGSYIVNDYLLTVAADDGGNGYLFTIRKGSEVQTIHLTELTQEAVDNAIEASLTQAKESGEFDGNGIESVVFNPDYTLSLYFTDGTSVTTGSIRGAVGNGIQGITMNPDYTLTITFTDGNAFTTEPVKGETGNGIAGVTLNSDYTLTVTYTDGTNTTTSSIRGAKGDTGNGISGVIFNDDYTLTINFTDGTSYRTDSIRGLKGETGTGVRSAVLNQDYTLTINLDDGTSYTTPSIRGQKGDKGDKGDPGDSFELHICSSVEYDHETRIPTVPYPRRNVLYLVPSEEGFTTDLFVEWAYIGNNWEKFGSASANLDAYAKKTDLNGKIDKPATEGLQGQVLTSDGSGGQTWSKAAVPDWNAASGAAGFIRNKPDLKAGTGTDSITNRHSIVSGTHSMATGTNNIVSGADNYVTGSSNNAKGTASILAGDHNTTELRGSNGLVGGTSNSVSNSNAIAAGSNNAVSGINSAATGNGNTASGSNSSVSGENVIANHKSQSASGEYNISDPSSAAATARGTYVEIIGNGTADNARSNARTLDWNGNEWIKGNFKMGGTSYDDPNAEELATKTYVDEHAGGGTVTDVQVNGTSVLDSETGVAEIPVASSTNAGVVKVDYMYGIGFIDASSGLIGISSASSAETKAGSNGRKPITPTRQHESTFYGLAKAAGDMTQSASNNPVGTYTDDAKSAIRTMIGAGLVDDVTVNGTSVVNNGAAAIPVASANTLGVVRTRVGDNGLQTLSDGYLATYPASSNDIKGGVQVTRPITSNRLNEAAFYGLAKAAGDTTQSASSNAVGTYTDNAKASIKAMLGVGGETQKVTVSGTAPTIVANQNTRYVCGEVVSLDFTPSAEGICDVIFTSGSTVTVLTIPNTVRFPEWFDPTALEANKTYEISISDGVYGAVMVW